MNAAPAVPIVTESRPRLRRPMLTWGLRLLLCAWAGFWVWFAVAVGVGEGAQAAPHVVKFVVPVLLATAAVWRWPRAGGVVLIGAGAWAAWYFNNPWAQGLLAAPAAALGLLFFVVRPGRREIPAVSSMPNAG